MNFPDRRPIEPDLIEMLLVEEQPARYADLLADVTLDRCKAAEVVLRRSPRRIGDTPARRHFDDDRLSDRNVRLFGKVEVIVEEHLGLVAVARLAGPDVFLFSADEITDDRHRLVFE